MRIAILEDDDSQRDWMNSFLLALGHVSHPFANSEALLRELRRENFDLLILDWNIPDMSGLEVVRWVRANLKAKVPVLFVTSHVDEGDLVEALKAGADDYMCKPVRVPELLARLHARGVRVCCIPNACSWRACCMTSARCSSINVFRKSPRP